LNGLVHVILCWAMYLLSLPPFLEAAIMVGLSALWMPIVVSAVFVFIALSIIHGMLAGTRAT
jgi:hypothetical protein